jgi:hypothetical protein
VREYDPPVRHETRDSRGDGVSEPNEQREPLPYRSPLDELDARRLRSAGGMTQFIAGLGLSLAAICFAGFVWFLRLYPIFPHDMSGKMSTKNILPMAFFITLGIGAAAGVYELVRRRRNRPYLVLGLLVGAALMALIEGLCFGMT